jgi:hypothetical protein
VPATSAVASGVQFTSFTSSTVQILTPEELQCLPPVLWPQEFLS